MKTTIAGLIFGLSIVLSCAPGLAQSSMSASSPAPMMAMPKCAAGDPMVGVNMSTKMYMTKDQMMAKSAGMTPDQKQAMMKQNHVKMMCKSAATAMGAKPMPKPSM